jgi:hypothetical protein
MKKKSANGAHGTMDDLDIPPLPRGALRHGVMGKYYRETMARSNVVRVAPDLTEAFPNEAAVNTALRELLRFRETLVHLTSHKGKRKKSA